MTRKDAFDRIINAIPNAVLRDRVEDSATTNASDTMRERGHTAAERNDKFWTVAIATAKMILDCPKDYYPELYN